MDLNICMASDENYATHLGICIVSLMENNSSNIIMHILNNNISERNIEKLKSLENQYENLKLIFYDIQKFFEDSNVDSFIKNQFDGRNDFYNRLGISAYLRLFLQDLFPKDIKKVLYLDCDMIVLDSLDEL